jgi:hypothetical protein
MLVDVTGDGIEEIVFWRSDILVALDANTGRALWESEPIAGALSARVWVAAHGLVVGDGDGFLSGLRLETGAPRWRLDLHERARSLCSRPDAVWVTTADDKTVAVASDTGENLGPRSTPDALELLTECQPIWGRGFPDQGHVKAWRPTDWSRLMEGKTSVSHLLPLPLPQTMSVDVYFYLPRQERWLMVGTQGSAGSVPALGYVGTPSSPLDAPWTQSITSDPDLSDRDTDVAVTPSSAFVAFPLRTGTGTGLAAFDLPSGRRRWEIQNVGPPDLSAIAASDHHVALSWRHIATRRVGKTQPSSHLVRVLHGETGASAFRLGGGF